jgi:hypothetical protein
MSAPRKAWYYFTGALAVIGMIVVALFGRLAIVSSIAELFR